MLDVFVGIGLTSVMILFILFHAIRMDKSEPWFAPFKPKVKAGKSTQTPWKRST